MSEGKVPQTFGEKLVFGIPAIIISLVLAVGIAFAIVSYFDNQMRDEVKKVKAELEEKNNKLAELLKEEQTKTVALQTQVKTLDEKTVKLAESHSSMAKELTAVASSTEKIALNLTEYKDGQKKMD